MSGATSYTVKRASSLNGIYSVIATNIFAPVVGSGITNATCLDPAPLAGTNYYLVASVNPNGSTNSSAVSAVIVVATPPQISSSRVVNGQFILNGSGGVSGSLYVVLASTNVALPLPQWIPIFTNTFDGSGNFSSTNAVDADAPQRFYLIRVP